jgi:hypothetical protein
MRPAFTNEADPRGCRSSVAKRLVEPQLTGPAVEPQHQDRRTVVSLINEQDPVASRCLTGG